jgi:hypothetical protein
MILTDTPPAASLPTAGWAAVLLALIYAASRIIVSRIVARQAHTEGSTALLVADLDSLRALSSEREGLLREREQELGNVKAVQLAQVSQIDRLYDRWRECEARHDVAIRRIDELERRLDRDGL